MLDKPDADAFRALLKTAVTGGCLSRADSETAFQCIMHGAVEDIPLAAFLAALSVRGETVAELQGAVHAVRSHMTALEGAPSDSIDVCGTGGDGLGTLNVSTAVAFVLAGLGVPVAKHGNRALSSLSGATDVLEKLGIPVSSDLEMQARNLRDHSLAFLAAPIHHPAMRHAAHVRKSLGFRTIFNLLGPLCNPAQIRRQLVGVFDARWTGPVAETLGALGASRAWVVHGTTEAGGSDELTLAGLSQISAWEGDRVFDLMIDPADTGLPLAPVSDIRGGDADHNAAALLALLEGAKGPYRDTVLLNAAVALHVSGRTNILSGQTINSDALRANIALAASSIDEGRARQALDAVRANFRAHDKQDNQDNAG